MVLIFLNSPKKAVNNKKRCGNYICLILRLGLRNTLGMDKTIATHTSWQCKNTILHEYGIYICQRCGAIAIIFIPKLKLRSLI